MNEKDRIQTELLVLACKRGDQCALRTLIERWEKRLLYYLRRLLGSEEDAWDALQETWLKALGQIRTLRDPAALSPWLYRIARNTAASRIRDLASDRDATEPLNDVDVGEIDPGIEQMADVQAIHAALDQLPIGQREALTLFFLEDLKISEISQITGSPEGTVKARLHHGKRAMRTILEQEVSAR